MKDNKNCKINSDNNCPFEELLNQILDNQKSFDVKVDNIMCKLFVGNGTPSFNTRLDRLEQDSNNIKKSGDKKWQMWVAVGSLVISAIITPIANEILKTNADTTNYIKIQATCAAGSITPGKGSYWKCKRLSSTNVSNYAA